MRGTIATLTALFSAATLGSPVLTLAASHSLAATPVALLTLGSHLVVETSAPNQLQLYSTSGALRPLATTTLSNTGPLAVTGSTLWIGSPGSTALSRVAWSAQGFTPLTGVSLTSPLRALVGVSSTTLLVSENDGRIHEYSSGGEPRVLATSRSLSAVPTSAVRVASGVAWWSYAHSNQVTEVLTGSSLVTRDVRAAGVVGAISPWTRGSVVMGLASRPAVQITTSSGALGAPLTIPLAGAQGVLGLASSGSYLFVLLRTSSGDQMIRVTISAGRVSSFSSTVLTAVRNEALVTPRPVALGASGPNDLWVLDAAAGSMAHYRPQRRSSYFLQPPQLHNSSSRPPAVGDTLTVNVGPLAGWTGVFVYAWYRCSAQVTPSNPTQLLDPRHVAGCRVIPGATKASYHTTSADAATHLLAVVTNPLSTLSAPTPWTPLLTSPPITELALPSISDVTSLNYRTGDVLHLAPGTWLNATSFTYQWYQCTNGVCSTPIPGATSQTYVLSPSDAGHQIEAEVTASSPVTSSVTRSTALSPPIV